MIYTQSSKQPNRHCSLKSHLYIYIYIYIYMYVYIIYTYIYLFFDLFMSKLNKDSSALHYQKITEKIQKKSRKSHQNLSEKEKTIK